MKYIMLLWPHANVRYQVETVHLAEAELRLILDRHAPDAQIVPAEQMDMPTLEITVSGELSEAALSAVRSHSLLYGLCEMLPDGLLRPVLGRSKAYLMPDLPGILKYKGKTNEFFLHLLMNAALFSSDFWNMNANKLNFYDPMCSRATSLFEAVNRGWNATGTDVDRNDLREADKFFKRYLEYHRYKHKQDNGALTLRGEKPAFLSTFTFAATPAAFSGKDTLSLRLVHCDAVRARDAFGKSRFHIIACDLPYGVQHSAGSGNIETLLSRALPVWKQVLFPGGAVALSFNSMTLKTERVQQIMAEAGFDVCEGGAYDGFKHWVEQAVTRDIAVCVKR